MLGKLLLIGLLLIVPYEFVSRIWDEYYASSSLGLSSYIASSLQTFHRTYKYAQLQDSSQNIRLMVLEAGAKWDPLRCRLVEVSFKQKPSYEALSYTWGEQLRKKPLTVVTERDSFTDFGTIEIGYNLWSALYHLRDAKKPRILWVDALCINQADLQEKSHQVPLMTFIYNRAKEVVVWLGPQRLPNAGYTALELMGMKMLTSDKLQSLISTDSRWIKGLLYSEYWKRAWIVQEVSMASTVSVYFGNDHIRWDDFIALAQIYQQLGATDKSVNPIFGLEDLRCTRYSGATAYALKTLVRMFRENSCSVIHDKIYAFVGMASDRLESTFTIDYNESVIDVYRRFLSSYAQLEAGNRETRIEMANLAGLTRYVLGRRAVSANVKYLSPPPRRTFGDRFYSFWRNGTFIEDGEEKVLPLIVPLVGYPVAVILEGFYSIAKLIVSLCLSDRKFQRSVWEHYLHENPTFWLASPTTTEMKHCSKIVLSCRIASEITHLGPLYDTVMSSSIEVTKWTSGLRNHVSNADNLQKARSLNQRFLDVLYDPENPAQNHILPLPYDEQIDYQSPRLFLGGGEAVSVGLAPDGVAVGDVICQLWNSNASAVLRFENSPMNVGEYRLIGRAGVVTTSGGIGWDLPKEEAFSLPKNERKIVDFEVDIATLTRLSFDSVNFLT